MAQRSYPALRPAAALVPGAAFDSAQPSVCSWRRASDETPRRVGEEAAFDVAALVLLGAASGGAQPSVPLCERSARRRSRSYPGSCSPEKSAHR